MATSPDLPPGWAIARVLEDVPNPNFPQFALPGFVRTTYICTDEFNQNVCSSGSEDDCNSQALTAAQSRTQQQPYNQPL